MLKQGQFIPLPMEQQVAVLYAAVNGKLEKVPVIEIQEWERTFTAFLTAQHRDLLKTIHDSNELSEDSEKKLNTALDQFMSSRA